MQAGGGLGQLGALNDGEAGAGLVGAGAVLCNALVDGLVLGSDLGDGQSPAEKVYLTYKSLVRYHTGLQSCMIMVPSPLRVHILVLGLNFTGPL